MHLLYRRYTRAGSAPPAFYVVAALAFLALAVWAVVESAWLVAIVATVMIVVAIAGSRLMRRLQSTADHKAEPARRDET